MSLRCGAPPPLVLARLAQRPVRLAHESDAPATWRVSAHGGTPNRLSNSAIWSIGAPLIAPAMPPKDRVLGGQWVVRADGTPCVKCGRKSQFLYGHSLPTHSVQTSACRTVCLYKSVERLCGSVEPCRLVAGMLQRRRSH